MGIEWPLTLFTIVAGTGAGVFAFAGISEFFGSSKRARFVSAIVAIILLVIGGCLSLLHLGNPANFMAAATNLFSFSPISLELIFLGLTVIVAIIYLFVVNREGSASRILGICGALVGIIFCYVSGHGYEVIAIRPTWATPALSFSYAFGELMLGGFLFLTLQAIFKDEGASLKKTALIVVIVAGLSTIAYIVYGVMAPIGEYAALFWICVVVVGGVLAFAAALYIYLKSDSSKVMSMSIVGLVAALAGSIVLRAIMWLSGSAYIADFFEVAMNSRGLFPF